MSENNPYQAPENNPLNEHSDGSDGSNIQLLEAKSLGIESGWQWIVDGFELFKKEPGLWIGMLITVAIIMVISSFIPFVSAIITPIFSAGFMYVCHRLYHGESIELADLFHGFKNQTASLAILGVINLAAAFVIGFLLVFIVGAGAGVGALGGEGGAVAGGIIGLLLAFMVSALLYIPVAMGLWFAPALVLFHHELKPVEAVLLSFKACLKNILPFLIYGIAVFIISIIASIPLFLGLLVAIPVIIASTYQGYRDIFTDTNREV